MEYNESITFLKENGMPEDILSDILNANTWSEEQRKDFVSFVSEGIAFLSAQLDSEEKRKHLNILKAQYFLYLHVITVDIKSLRSKTGLSQQKFADALNIPKRTIENWESQKATPPRYVVDLIKFRIEHDSTFKN